MGVDAAALATSIKTTTGFTYPALPGYPQNGLFVDELASIICDMWKAGTTKQAPGTPPVNPGPPPPFLDWVHTHDDGADGLSPAAGTIGSAKAFEVADAIATGVKNHLASELQTAVETAPAGTGAHNHNVTGVGSVGDMKDSINTQMDLLPEVDRGSAPDLQTFLDSVASEVISHFTSNAVTENAADVGDGTHVHGLE